MQPLAMILMAEYDASSCPQVECTANVLPKPSQPIRIRDPVAFLFGRKNSIQKA